MLLFVPTSEGILIFFSIRLYRQSWHQQVFIDQIWHSDYSFIKQYLLNAKMRDFINLYTSMTKLIEQKLLAHYQYELQKLGLYYLMLKFLQIESQKYFSNRNYGEVFSMVQSSRSRVEFYTLLIIEHLSSNKQLALSYLAETSVQKKLDIPSLLSAIWGVSLQINPFSQQAKKLFNLVSALNSRNIIDRSQLLADIPEWVVQGAGLIQITAFDKKIARVYTKINYQQSKYSLLRQNNEGYAKMTLLLINIQDSHDLQAIWHRMLDLVGNYDLDPDRVLDLVIEARVHNYSTNSYLSLLNNFRKESISVVLGNKLRTVKGKPIEQAHFEKLVYQGSMQTFQATSFRDTEQVISPHLISLCAELIKNGAITYNDLLPYLQPGDHYMRHANSKRLELALSKIKQCFTLIMEELDESEKVKLKAEENLKFQGQLLHSTKLAIISQLVRLNDWSDFQVAWSSYKNKIDLLFFQPLLKHLLDLIQWAIEPLTKTIGYQRYFRVQKNIPFIYSRLPKEYGQIESLEKEQLQRLDLLLSYVGKYIGFRPALFIKLCRIFKKHAKTSNGQEIKPIIQKYLLTGSCVAENNAPMSIEFYDLLDCYEYQFRYDCYLKIYQGGMSDCPYVAKIFEAVKRKQNIIVNNLSKETKKLFLRKIAKLTHNQALPVFYWIIRRIVMEDYEAVVPQIVVVLNNSSPLTLDIAIFVMLYTLNESKETPVNSKTHECHPWFKNVTTFISNFFRKYLETDIQPVFDFIITKTGKTPQLDDEQLPGDLLKLLHEILNKMHGSVIISEVNKTKYDAIAAGPKLQAQILQFSSEVRAAKKSKVFLQKFFWERNAVHQDGYSLAFNLLILLAQKRAELFVKGFIDNIKIVGEIFDQYSLLIVQVVRVLLHQAQDYNHYAQLLPTNAASIMLKLYKLPLEIVSEILRPSIKHIAAMTNEQWQQLTTQFHQAYSQCLKDEQYLVKSSRVGEKWQTLLNGYKEKVIEFLPKTFFTAFWFLTLDSLYFPAKSYKQKIQDLKKKLQSNRKGDKNDKQNERMKTLLEKLHKQQQTQRKKYLQTISQDNLKKIQVDILLGTVDKGKQAIFNFAQQFVQVCLLPRMMLDRTQALYCVKFTIQMIRVNKMQVTKSIRLLTYIIQFVMGYLPYTTHREASTCISVFMAEILDIFNNWNDSVKLKQDLKSILGVEDAAGKDNYPKLKDYLVKLYERVGNTLRGVKEEPYLIKNCLYILEKVDSIPSYIEQADELIQHMNELKDLYSNAVDMRTSLDRQIAILGSKKAVLPARPQRQEEKKVVSNKNEQVKVSQKDINPPLKITNLPSKSPITHQLSNNSQNRQYEQNKQSNKGKNDGKQEQKLSEAYNQQKFKSKFTEKPPEKRNDQKDRNEQSKKQDKKNQHKNTTNNTHPTPNDLKPEGKIEVSHAAPPPKTVKQLREQMLNRQSALATSASNQASIENKPISATVTNNSSTISNPPVNTAGFVGPVNPQTVSGDQIQNNQSNAAKPKLQEVKMGIDQLQNSQKPASLVTTEQINQLNQSTKQLTAQKTPNQSKKQIIIKEDKQEEEKPPSKKQNNHPSQQKRISIQRQAKPISQRQDKKLSPTPQRKKDERWKDKDNKREKEKEPRQFKDNKDKQGRERQNRARDRERQMEREGKSKGLTYTYTRERKSQERRQQSRKQEKRERSKQREKQREKDKDRDRERRYEKYHRSRSREKYGRR